MKEVNEWKGHKSAYACLPFPAWEDLLKLDTVIIEVKAPNIRYQEMGPVVTQDFTVAILAIC